MMFNVLTQWIQEFIGDLEKESPSYKARMLGRTFSTIDLPTASGSYNALRDSAEAPVKSVLAKKRTPEKIKLIIKRSAENNIVHQKLDYWKGFMTEKGKSELLCLDLLLFLGKELKAAIGDWQKRHNEKDHISTGFLDGASPIVDIYELKLRLSHVLRRLRFLQDAHATEPPSQVLEYLYVGNSLSSQGIHLLRRIGITHIINATKVSWSWSILEKNSIIEGAGNASRKLWNEVY